MPELNPRRVAPTKARFAQVAAAVLAGMAAMFCLQNVIEFRREAALPAAPPAEVPAGPQVPEPDINLPQGVRRQAGPAPSSMLLKPEPGISRGGGEVVAVSGEEAPPVIETPAAPPPPPAPKKKKEMPHLENRDMESKFASSAVRNDGRFSSIKRRKTEEAAPVYTYEPPKAAPVKTLQGSSGIKVLEREAEAEHLQPAPLAQITVPEKVFWTKERKINVGAALIILVLGVAYVIYASGIRDDAPAREEGEL